MRGLIYSPPIQSTIFVPAKFGEINWLEKSFKFRILGLFRCPPENAVRRSKFNNYNNNLSQKYTTTSKDVFARLMAGNT